MSLVKYRIVKSSLTKIQFLCNSWVTDWQWFSRFILFIQLKPLTLFNKEIYLTNRNKIRDLILFGTKAYPKYGNASFLTKSIAEIGARKTVALNRPFSWRESIQKNLLPSVISTSGVITSWLTRNTTLQLNSNSTTF